MKVYGLAIAAVLAACWTTPRAPASPGALPGLVWITPAQPWRMTHAPLAIAADGDTALVGGAHGWIARVDLRTGAIVRERRDRAGVTFHDIARLRDRRWIAVGSERDRTIAVIIDGDTLATRPINLGAVPDRGSSIPGVAVLADGGVVIAGKGLPLAVYEPRTWAIRAVIAPELGWARPALLGTTLAITRGGAAFAFELATNQRTALGPSASAQAVGARAVLKIYDRGKWFAEVWNAGTKRARLPEPIDTFALTPDATRLITAARGKLEIHALGADPAKLGAPVARIELGPTGLGVGRLVVDGERAFVSAASMLRVVDLRTGVVTSAGDAPWGAPNQLAVGTDDTVVELADFHVWRLASGRVTAAAELGDHDALVMQPHDVAHYAVRRGREISLHALAGGATRTWAAPQDPLEGWVGRTGSVVLDVLFDAGLPSQLYRSEGRRLTPVIGYAASADVRDVDPDGGVALIATGGRIHIVNLARGEVAPFTLRTPGCAEFASAELERGGTRVTTYDGHDLAVWDRTTGGLVGTTRFEDEILHTSFVPGRDELVVGLTTGLVLLRPGHEARVLALPDYTTAQVSSDGRRLAIGFSSGRVALVDLDTLRQSLAPELPRSFTMVKDCKADNPFEVEPSDDMFEGASDD